MPRAKDGAVLAKLVRMAIPLCRRAERSCHRRRPGPKPEFPAWAMAVLIMVAVLARRKSKTAQYHYLWQRRWALCHWLGWKRFPVRSTYFHRYGPAHELFQAAIRLQTRKAIAEGFVAPACVAVDKSVIRARGPVWHEKYVKKKGYPKGADREATWTYSRHHGWVQGYAYEVVVSAGKKGPVWPLLASAEPASRSEKRSFPEKVPFLAAEVKVVLADAGYDSNPCAEAVEWTPEGKHTGRRFLCPPVQRTPRKPGNPVRPERAQSRKRRDQRLKFLDSRRGRNLFVRRGTSVEPFNEWFKTLFELNERVWHRGLDNNRTQLLAALFCYQLLLRYNHRRGRPNGQIKAILDAL